MAEFIIDADGHIMEDHKESSPTSKATSPR